jgi:hypothetical protein
MMTVQSLDTREPIQFTKAVLVDHPRTKAYHRPGQPGYADLCLRYPEQVDLIKSILFPVSDINKAIAADDLTLLAFGDGFLEPAEQPVLVMAVEKFLSILVERWYFDFLDDEPYFHITFWGSLWTYLGAHLLACRLENIRTPYVHSWHIWNALADQGLDNYSDILDRKKAMLLYENIEYFKANAGKQSNLIILANRLLAEFGVALYGREVVQESETAADAYQLTPQMVPVRIPTDYALLATEVVTETVGTIQTQIFAKGLTPSDSQETIDTVTRALGDTVLNGFITKFLEIRPIPRNKPYAEVLNLFVLETLVLCIEKGYYASRVEVLDPVLGIALYLTPKELLALYHYAALRSLGITETVFPTQMAYTVSFLPEIGVPKTQFPWHDQTVYVSQQVDAADYLSGLSYTQAIYNPSQFSDMLSALWLRFMDHHLQDLNTGLEKKRRILAYLDPFCRQKRVDTLDLVSDCPDYETWFSYQYLDIARTIVSHYDNQDDAPAQWGALADTILSTLVPLTDILSSFGNYTLSDIGYSRLRELFTQLCSYKVVFLESERDVPDCRGGDKWSTDHGPDAIHSYGELISTIVNAHTDAVAVEYTTHLLPYVVEKDKDAVVSQDAYQLVITSQWDTLTHTSPIVFSAHAIQEPHSDHSVSRVPIITTPPAFSLL